MPLLSVNCSLILRVLIHQDGFIAGVPSILQMRKAFASTQIIPLSNPFSFFLAMPQDVHEMTFQVFLPEKSEFIVSVADLAVMFLWGGLCFSIEYFAHHFFVPSTYRWGE